MIPHRVLSNQIVAKGLKNRVSACRKRLRFNRPAREVQTSHRVDNELEQVFPETSLLTSDILDDHSAGRGSLISMESSAAFVDGEQSHSKMLRTVEEHRSE
jgi:hypothetical protein